MAFAVGTLRHEKLRDIHTPHWLAELEAAVCSETEADVKVDAHNDNVIDSHGRVGGILPAGQVPDLDAAKVVSGRFGVARMPDGSLGQVLTAQGVGVNPAYQALSAAKVASGSYTGNNTSNRAVAHGLGVVPRMVFITRHEDSGVECWYRIMGGLNRIFWQWSGAVSPSGRYAVTAPDATSFYVGNSSEYSRSANYGGDLLYWVAIA